MEYSFLTSAKSYSPSEFQSRVSPSQNRVFRHAHLIKTLPYAWYYYLFASVELWVSGSQIGYISYMRYPYGSVSLDRLAIFATGEHLHHWRSRL